MTEISLKRELMRILRPKYQVFNILMDRGSASFQVYISKKEIYVISVEKIPVEEK